MYVDEKGVFRCDCGSPIVPYRRVRAGFKTCLKCADKNQSKPVGFMVFDHKTAPRLVRVDSRDTESLRRANRAHKRAR